MVYSQVVKRGFILSKKAKFTKRDLDKVLINSLFGRYGVETLSIKQAAFIVKCSAVFWGVEYSKAIEKA